MSDFTVMKIIDLLPPTDVVTATHLNSIIYSTFPDLLLFLSLFIASTYKSTRTDKQSNPHTFKMLFEIFAFVLLSSMLIFSTSIVAEFVEIRLLLASLAVVASLTCLVICFPMPYHALIAVKDKLLDIYLEPFIEVHRKDVNSLTTRLQEVQNQRIAAELTTEARGRTIDQLNSDNYALKLSSDEMQSKLQQVNERFSQFKEDIQVERENHRHVHSQLLTSQTALERARRERIVRNKSSQPTEAAQPSTKIATEQKLTQQLEKVQAKLLVESDAHWDAKQQASRAEVELRKSQVREDRSSQRCKDALRQQSSLAHKVNKLEDENDKLRAENSDLRAENSDLGARNNADRDWANSEYGKLVVERDDLMQRLLQAKELWDGYQNTIEALGVALASKDAENRSLQRHMSHQKQQQEQHLSKLLDVEHERDSLKSRCEELQKQLATPPTMATVLADAKHARRETDAWKSRCDRLEELAAEGRTMRSSLGDAQRERDGWKSRCEGLQAELANAQQQPKSPAQPRPSEVSTEEVSELIKIKNENRQLNEKVQTLLQTNRDLRAPKGGMLRAPKRN